MYGRQARELASDELFQATTDEKAADYIRQSRAVRPHGPYRLLGCSVNGDHDNTASVLHQEEGDEVDFLALLDAYQADQRSDQAVPRQTDALTALRRMARDERTDEGTREDVLETLRREGSAPAGPPDRMVPAVVHIVVNNAHLMGYHRHRLYTGDVLFFTAAALRADK
ncbi:hypothetical protein [Streptomyces rimosus]|uniref:hypothetical protein n=1 Tax=Streptomyces rimosus TaxID=1927 RepID=UPI00311D88D3